MIRINSALHKKLSTTKPIAFIDIESTGVLPETDRIVEITIAKVHVDGTIEVKTKRFNPEVPIPAGATKIHGITDADVANEPTFKKVARAMLNFITGCDLAGYASNRFDIPILNAEFIRAGVDFDYQGVVFYDICNIFMRKEGRTLVDAYRFYCGKELVGAHGSAADAMATLEVFEAQLDKYADLPKDPAQLDLFGNYDKTRVDIGGKLALDEDGDIVANFGGDKTKGKKLKNDLGLCNWILDKGFPADVNSIVRKILESEKTPA